MFKSKIPHFPKAITRQEFVRAVFEFGYKHQQQANTTVIAVLIGDHFVNTKDVSPFISSPRSFKRMVKSPVSLSKWEAGEIFAYYFRKRLLHQPIRREYSVDLAEVVDNIACKICEDMGDWSYLVMIYHLKMEKEVCALGVVRHYQTFLGLLFRLVYIDVSEVVLSYMCQKICLIPNFHTIKPTIIVIALLLLWRRKKLHFRLQQKMNYVARMFSVISLHMELSFTSVIRQYLDSMMLSACDQEFLSNPFYPINSLTTEEIKFIGRQTAIYESNEPL